MSGHRPSLFGYLTLVVVAGLLSSTVSDYVDDTIRFANLPKSMETKRYARMSNFRAPPRRQSYYHHKFVGKEFPWSFLPKRHCFRQKCESNSDCCFYHNICDSRAKICYDCWYGYPCQTSADCCYRYPRCSLYTRRCIPGYN